MNVSKLHYNCLPKVYKNLHNDALCIGLSGGLTKYQFFKMYFGHFGIPNGSVPQFDPLEGSHDQIKTFNRCHHCAQIFPCLEIIGKKAYGPRFGVKAPLWEHILICVQLLLQQSVLYTHITYPAEFMKEHVLPKQYNSAHIK